MFINSEIVNLSRNLRDQHSEQSVIAIRSMSLPLRNLPPPLVVVLVLVDILAKSDILATINRSFDFDNGGFVGLIKYGGVYR